MCIGICCSSHQPDECDTRSFYVGLGAGTEAQTRPVAPIMSQAPLAFNYKGPFRATCDKASPCKAHLDRLPLEPWHTRPDLCTDQQSRLKCVPAQRRPESSAYTLHCLEKVYQLSTNCAQIFISLPISSRSRLANLRLLKYIWTTASFVLVRVPALLLRRRSLFSGTTENKMATRILTGRKINISRYQLTNYKTRRLATKGKF